MSTRACIAASLFVLTFSAARAEAPRPVRVQAVVFTPAQQAVTYPGDVQARVQANLAFRVGGKIIDRLVNIGDHVTAGQPLARLDPADLRLSVEADTQAVRAAEAEAVNAHAEYERYQRMGRGSPAWIASEFDRRKAAMDGADARLAQAQRQLALAHDQLNYTELHADADGVITDIRMEVGQVIAAGQTVASLAHTAETEIVVNVPENRLPDVRDAQQIGIRLWSRPDVELTGRTREIGALADPLSRTFAIRITVLNPPPDTLALGMTAAVTFRRSAGAPVALLPASAVVGGDNHPAVWVLDEATHRATRHPVQVAAWRGDGQVAITDGLHPGDQVVTAGASQLDAATPVTAWAGTIR
ncbi:MAG TPA: efflux RND transporter periplasmic adaptor subunit [Rhodopila sp.]|nr:efflux RND transporter periplasmic adaptor subunit [Rhodopila sp.]